MTKDAKGGFKKRRIGCFKLHNQIESRANKQKELRFCIHYSDNEFYADGIGVGAVGVEIGTVTSPLLGPPHLARWKRGKKSLPDLYMLDQLH